VKEREVGKLLIRYSVNDYELWRAGFEAHAAAREIIGMRKVQVYRSTDTPNELVLIIEIEDRRRTEEFASSEEVRLSNLRLGVVGVPERYYLE
jgi:hypothetical protein